MVEQELRDSRRALETSPCAKGWQTAESGGAVLMVATSKSRLGSDGSVGADMDPGEFPEVRIQEMCTCEKKEKFTFGTASL